MRYSLLFIVFVATLAACYQEPEFPVEPQIEFANVAFVESKDPGKPNDTLKITVTFRDGDGDLGLLSTEKYPSPPFHIYDSIFNQQIIKFGDNDTLPPLNCQNYIPGYFQDGNFIFSQSPDKVTDHLYIQQNPFYFNFFIEIFTIRGGKEEFFDFAGDNYPNCRPPIHGRFSINSLKSQKPVSGTITYNFDSQFILPFLGSDSLRVRVKIADRALHMSNQVESSPFTLKGIQTNR